MPYTAITFDELKTRLAARLETQPYWTDAEAGLFLNEALLTWNQLTGRWKQRLVYETTKNTYEVALPEMLLYRMRIEFNGYPMSPSSRTDLNLGRPRWRQENTVSGGDVPIRPMVWAPVSLRLLYIWPMDAAGKNSLVIDGVAKTPVLVAPDDTVDLAEGDISALLGFALHLAAFKKGGPWFTATFPYFQQFLAAAAEENSLITTSQIYRRFMGLDHRDLKPLIGAPSSVGSLATQVASAGTGGGS